MLVSELDHLQLLALFEISPEWVCENRPEWAVDNRVKWMLYTGGLDHLVAIYNPETLYQHKPQWLIDNYPEWMCEYHTADLWAVKPEFVAAYRPEWVWTNYSAWMKDNRPEWVYEHKRDLSKPAITEVPASFSSITDQVLT